MSEYTFSGGETVLVKFLRGRNCPIYIYIVNFLRGRNCPIVNFFRTEGGRVCPRGGDTVLVNSIQGEKTS